MVPHISAWQSPDLPETSVPLVTPALTCLPFSRSVAQCVDCDTLDQGTEPRDSAGAVAPSTGRERVCR